MGRLFSRYFLCNELIISKSNLKKVDNASCHCSLRLAGHIINILLINWRAINSLMIKPASIVFPRPTSSAISNRTRGELRAIITGTSWKLTGITVLLCKLNKGEEP